MVRLSVHGLTKHFGTVTAVDGVDLAVEPGELFFLLGPSGCGKTTVLRMLAGFVEPDAGSIRFGERDVTRLPAHRRNCGMVFQNYALWPHLTVAQNVEFGLRVRKMPSAQRRQRVDEMLSAVRLEGLGDRKPAQLSGGQQQRVALARALAIRPALLLLDEPLSNLDAKLRIEMRSEIVRICRDSGVTAIYVTHDQKEALSMADRLAVVQAGKVVQVGGPHEVYRRPANGFVADFLGRTNFVPGTVASAGNGATRIDCPSLGALVSTCAPPGLAVGAAVTCSLRPEVLRLGEGPINNFQADLVETVYLGELAQHTLQLPAGHRLTVFELHPQLSAGPGKIRCHVAPGDVVLLAGEP